MTLALLLLLAAPPCALPNLMVRTEASPRSAAFTRGATAFDRATTDWGKRRFIQAARSFLQASAEFAADGVEGNWKYALQNAVMAFEASGQVDEGKKALEAAAARDLTHAEALRAAAAALTARTGCH
jgi:hypothetical protein